MWWAEEQDKTVAAEHEAQAQRERAATAEADRDTMRRSSEHNYEACVRALADRDEAVGLLREADNVLQQVWDILGSWLHREDGELTELGIDVVDVLGQLSERLARLPSATVAVQAARIEALTKALASIADMNYDEAKGMIGIAATALRQPP